MLDSCIINDILLSHYETVLIELVTQDTDSLRYNRICYTIFKITIITILSLLLLGHKSNVTPMDTL